MNGSTAVVLYEDVLLLSREKLLCRGEVICDFTDRYTNISAMNLEQQLSIYTELAKLIGTSVLPGEVKAEVLLVAGLLMRSLSRINEAAAVLSIGGGALNDSLAHITRLFRNDNEFHKLSDTSAVAGRSFSVILVSGKQLRSEALLDDCLNVLKKKGTVIVYGLDADLARLPSGHVREIRRYALEPDRIAVLLEIEDNRADEVAYELKGQLLEMIRSVLPDIEGALNFLVSAPPSESADWVFAADDLISTVDQIESLIAEHHTVFDNPDLKFQINEFKNALLDYKYQFYLSPKHGDYYLNALVEKWNDWLNGLH